MRTGAGKRLGDEDQITIEGTTGVAELDRTENVTTSVFGRFVRVDDETICRGYGG